MIISLIFSGFLLIDLVVYLVSFFKNKNLSEKISLFIFLPLTYGITIPFFKASLPDSMNTMIFSSIAVLFASLIPLLRTIKFKSNTRLVKLSLLLSLFFWFLLYQSSFYLYRMPVFAGLIVLAVFLGVFVFFLFKLHINKIHEGFTFFVILGVSFAVVFISLTTLLFSKNLSGILCFSGAVILSVYAVSRKISEKKVTRFSPMINNLLLFTGTSLLSASAVLLQY